jgi:hypothetical protein
VRDFKLWLTPVRARRAIKALAREQCPGARVMSFGATWIDPRHLSIWIKTRTDQQRDRLAANRLSMTQMREAPLDAGYPQLAVPQVQVGFESQETIDRDYHGNWFLRFK